MRRGKYAGFARSYVLAEEIVSYTDCKLESSSIYSCLEAYQKNKMLTIEEIANFGVFLKIAIISHIKEICERIYSSQLQRFKVEAIIERVIENKKQNERVFINNFKGYSSFENELKYPFIEYMSYRLKKYGKNAVSYQEALEEQVLKLGITVPEIIQKEHLYIANLKITVGNCIKSLRDISRINFTELLGNMNGTEVILNRDPAGVYPYMDIETKNEYKAIIEKLSKRTKISEIYIAEKIIEITSKNLNDGKNKIKEKIKKLDAVEKENIEKINLKEAHVGYYLIDNGYDELKNILLNKENKKIRTPKFKAKLYSASFFAITFYIDFLITMGIFFGTKKLSLAIISCVLLVVPISEIVIRIMNYFMMKLKKSNIIPKMDYENKIPDDKKTIVVIPTILKSKDKVIEMMKKLEVYYLANPEKNLYFALLGDASEENEKITSFDKEVVIAGLNEVKRLNEKYKQERF